MRYFRAAAFKRLYRKLSLERRQEVDKALHGFGGMLEEGRPLPEGLGLKLLRPGLWEIRAGLMDRILFSRQGASIEFLVLGTHDEVRRFLKRA